MKTRIRQLTEQEKRSRGESQMITDWLKIFPKGILSIVSDTFIDSVLFIKSFRSCSRKIG